MVTTSSCHGSRRTRSTAAQIPIAQALTGYDPSGLPPFEHAPALVVGDDLIELLLLVPAVVEVVLVHRLAEGALGKVTFLPEVERLVEGGRERLGLGGLVRVPLELGSRIGAVLDPVETGGDQRRARQIGVYVGARDPALHPARLAVPDDPEPAGSVVAAPRDGGRGPALGGVAFVGVDRRSDEQRQLPDVLPHPPEVVAEGVRLLVAVHEDALAVAVDEARVDVTGAPDVLLR